MNLFLFTVIDVVFIEIVFLIVKKGLPKKRLSGRFVSTLVLGFAVWGLSMAGLILMVVPRSSTVTQGNVLLNFVLIFFNVAYGYFRGLGRIADLNKK